ncbi:MAG: DUF2796 domain-containing protein [Roseateles depolymerans]|uniref:DUF2796 domain-containing protein n=1 Tax=Roseateles depolymerans TaxID=76731 RepID=A0A2W5DUU8_9BURK|nr:MAG: DUF2796 domain-containing protein [Roseateles depolymerans]
MTRTTRVRPLRGTLLMLAGLALLGARPAAAHEGAHQHGVMHLDIAIQGRALTLQLEAPLDSLLGFERRPRNDAERQAVRSMLQTLRQGQALWQPDPAAGCRLLDVQLESPLLQPPQAAEPHEHLDLDADFSFQCERPDRLGALQQQLFEHFPRLQRLLVQLAGPNGQHRLELQRPDPRIVLRP